MGEGNPGSGCQDAGWCDPPPPVVSPPSPYSHYTVPPSPPPPPVSQSHPHPSFTKSVMATAVLISTILLFVSLYITFVRWYKGRNPQRRAMQQQQPPPAADQFLKGEEPINYVWYINTVGLEESLINSITSCKFKSGEGLIEETGCSVCLSEFEDGDDVRLLPKCSHAFHLRCIDRWLRAHVNCPLCRAPVFANHLNSASGENNTAGSPSVDASYDSGSTDGRESNGERSSNLDSLAVEIGSSGRLNETAMANPNILRVNGEQSSGDEQNGMTVEEETEEFQPVRRSVSLNSLCRIPAPADLTRSSSREFSDLPCGSVVETGSSNSGNLNLAGSSGLTEVPFETRGGKSEREGDREPCLQKGPSAMKRSFSIGTNFFFSKHGRNRSSVLPL
ncbi:unnamed protein product [Victoria cruziana]